MGIRPARRPAVDDDEYLRVAALAAEAAVPTFTHGRDLIEMVPHAPVDGAEEIVRAAGQTGAHIIELLDENDAADRELLLRSLTFPSAVVASDAMPLTWTGLPDPLASPPEGPLARPPGATAITHRPDSIARS